MSLFRKISQALAQYNVIPRRLAGIVNEKGKPDGCEEPSKTRALRSRNTATR